MIAQRTIIIAGPFSLPLMLASVLRRPNEVVDLAVGGTYHRLLEHRGRTLLLRAAQHPTDQQALCLSVEGSAHQADEADLVFAEACLRRLFSLDASPQPFYDLVQADPVLRPLTVSLRGLRPLGSPTIFEMLVVAILGQQISLIAAGAIKRRLVQSLGARAMIGDHLYQAFPSPESLAEATHAGLIALAFSARKAEYVRDLARRVAAGELDLEALRGRPHAEILEALIAQRGIGRWTAEYVLLRGYGYPDALPAGDAGLRRQLTRLYALPTPPTEAQIIEMAARWTPYRSWATLYLWNSEFGGGSGTGIK